MAKLLVRELDDELVRLLKQRARSHSRSAEAEHRAILEAALRPGGEGFAARARRLQEATRDVCMALWSSVPIAVAAMVIVAPSRRSTAVVDASVAVKWVMAEGHAEAALLLLENGIGLAAPAHWLGEPVNAVWAATRRGELAEDEAQERAATLAEAPVAAVPLGQPATVAMTIALRLGIAVYDSLYLALAERQDATLVTDDRRLLPAARRNDRLRDRVLWLGETPVTKFSRGLR